MAEELLKELGVTDVAKASKLLAAAKKVRSDEVEGSVKSTTDWERRLSEYRASQPELRLGATKRPKVAKSQSACGTIMLTCSLKRQTTSTYRGVRPNKMVGTFLPSDGVDAMKRKIALAYGMNLPLPVQTKLLHKNAEVDCSVFTSLSSFLERLPSSTARSNIFSLGLPPDYELEEMEDKSDVVIVKQEQSSRWSKPAKTTLGSSTSVCAHPLSSPSSSSGISGSSVHSSLGLITYTMKDIKKGTGDMCQLLGSGSFGTVYRGRLRSTEVAVKVLKDCPMGELNMKAGDTLAAEVEILSRYRHNRLVQIFGVCSDPTLPAIVYELMVGGSLFSHLHLDMDLTDIRLRLQILTEAAEGLSYLHSTQGNTPAVVHLDVKSSNILLDGEMHAKISDFGMAKKMPLLSKGKSFVKVNEACGTAGYQAPEYLRGEMGPKLDVYSFGVVLLETYSGQLAYDENRNIPALDAMFSDSFGKEGLQDFKQLVDPSIPESDFVPYASIQALAHNCLKPRHRRVDMEEVQVTLACINDELH